MGTVDKHTVVQEISDFAQTIPLVLRIIGAELKQSGYEILPVHLRLLSILSHGPCNLSALADMQAVSLPTMSNSVSVLVERGWVERMHAPHDRRVVVVELTTGGRAVLDEIKHRATQHLATRLAPLSQKEYKTLVAGLAVLRRALAPIIRSEVDKLPCERIVDIS